MTTNSVKKITRINAITRESVLRPLIGFASALVLALGFASSAYAMKAPDQVVRDTVDGIVTKIQQNRATYKADTNALYAMVEQTLLPAIHVPRMSNLILGKEVAKKASPQQKAAFANEFKTLLLRSYATALLDYTGDEKVVYEPINLAPGTDIVTVKAALISASGKRYNVNLMMSNRKDTQWRAFNLDVAGINFVSTYKATFGQTIAQKGLDGLIADLRAKNSR